MPIGVHCLAGLTIAWLAITLWRTTDRPVPGVGSASVSSLAR
jgi:hypothetical protein